MRTPILAAAALAIMPLSACATNDRYYADDWSQQYRSGSYEPYALGRNDQIYRGGDGRYYCKRRDGTVGLVVGAGVGGLLGNLIAPRGSKTIGAIIGAAGGALAGRAIERGEVRCE